MIEPSQIINTLRVVVDPEIGVNIVDLGLIYNVEIENNVICVAMTMTSPICPLGEMIVSEAEMLLRRAFPQAAGVRVELVWDPPWSPEKMTAQAKKQLGWNA